MNKAEEICNALKLDYSQVLNIYPYGSQVYGTATEESDSDYIIVFKSSLLPSGAFKDNAISSDDRKIQGTCYSRSGFQDAINNYQMPVLEALFLPENEVIQNKMKFKMYKFDKKEFIQKTIKLASASWFNAKLAQKDSHLDSAKKNIFHAIRILDFALQIKEHGTIVNYASMNSLKRRMAKYTTGFNMHCYTEEFMKMSNLLKE